MSNAAVNGGGSRSGDVERALALRDVMDHAVKVHQESTDIRQLDTGRGRRITAAVICVPLLALSVYSWVARPELIWGPRHGAVAPARREANLRLAMFLLARRIMAYKASQGQLPASLAEIDERTARGAGIGYRLLSDSEFELRSTEGGSPIVYRSTDSASALLRNSVTAINAAK